MPNPHLKITITQRSKKQSAVAGAAYQSGENLFSEYDQKRKNYKNKQGILYTEIMLPSHAPPEYADRETLWNAVEAVETQWNSQLARRFVLALPRELSEDVYPVMLREYCQQHFVDKGMICDFAIHNTEDDNPHAHIMLTLRAMDEHGKWLPKSRKVYDLDENGERIRLPSGNWKSHKENTTDWNEQSNAEIWRSGWADIQNKYLEAAGQTVRVDLRSYERQGIDKIPTVHMGPAVTQMERRGIKTNIGNLNRDIQAANRMMVTIRKTIKSLLQWFSDVSDAIKDALAELKEPEEPSSPRLSRLLERYLQVRQDERCGWSRKGQVKANLDDMQAILHAINYLEKNHLYTLQDLDDVLNEINSRAGAIRSDIRSAKARMKTITNIQKAVAVCAEHQTIHDKYVKIGWKTVQAVYAETHQDKLDAYNKAFRFLKKQGVDLAVDLTSLQAEYDSLEKSIEENSKTLSGIKEDLKPLKEIRYWINKGLEPAQEKTPAVVPIAEQLEKGREDAQAYNERRHSAPEPEENMER